MGTVRERSFSLSTIAVCTLYALCAHTAWCHRVRGASGWIDINDSVVVSNAISDQSNDEDSAFSFTVPSNTFTDEDGDTLTYTATLEDGTALPTWLTFDAATQTFSGTPLNDNVGTISVTVTASDGSLTASDTFTLTVVNTNDDPTAVSLSATAIDENGDGVVVGDLSTSDVDVGDTHTYTLSGDDAASFEVVNGQLKLKDGVSADFETKSTYAVTVTTTDGSGSTYAQSFSITITDVNEAPTSITLSASAIDENAAGAVVGTLTTTCLLYTSPSPRDKRQSRMPSSA